MTAKLYKFLFLISTLFIFGGCFDSKKDDNAKQSKPAQMPPISVDVMVAKKGDNPMSFEYPARLESMQDIVIVPKVSGAIVEQKFKPGDSVKGGDVLFVIEKDRFLANYDVANAKVEQALALQKSSKNEMDRILKLYSQKAISQKEYDNALANYQNANASLSSAKANLKLAKLDLEHTEIKAPFSGVVGENLVDVGTYVNASSTNLVRLSKIDVVNARYYIADSANLLRVSSLEGSSWEQVNQDAKLILNGEEFIGKVKFIDSVIDVNTASVLAKAEFKNTSNKLLPGTFAKVVMSGFVQKDSFLLPQIAIKQDAVSAYVLVDQDTKVVKKQVKIVYQTSDKAIISEGLNDGDKIILNNFNKIRLGANVKAEIRESN